MTTIDPHIFRAYDIRGKAHAQLSEEACELIGKGFGSILREKYSVEHPTVILGRDARTHSPLLEDAMRRGLVSTGCFVFDIGQTPSPVNYFTICSLSTHAGVQITASHNPKDDNGVKLQTRDAEAFSGEDLQVLRKRIDAGNFLAGEGKSEQLDAINPYLEFLEDRFDGIGAKRKIVVDCGNGVTGPVNIDALKRAGVTVVPMYETPDGNFPNHQPDPSKWDTLSELQLRVVQEDADFGIAFDGDGDRMGIVDERGEIRSADEILLLLAENTLKRFPASPVVFTVSNSEILNTEVIRLKGIPVMAKVGHSFVEHAMREHGAKIGGEQSGHFFCAEDYYGFDDALVASFRFIGALEGKSVTDAMAHFPKVFQAPEIRPFCPDEKKAEVITKVTEHFSRSFPVNTLDGARIDFGDGAWAGIRMSNTSPCLSICMEARTPEKLEEVKKEVLEHMGIYEEVKF